AASASAAAQAGSPSTGGPGSRTPETGREAASGQDRSADSAAEPAASSSAADSAAAPVGSELGATVPAAASRPGLETAATAPAPDAAPVGSEPAAASAAQPATGRLAILRSAADRLHEAAGLLEPLPAFDSALRAMREREDSLRGGRFTLALFGAFSAGKSSFANALLGDSFLPVSPHPTTASISRIMAPERAEDHGRALVVMKTEEELMGDLADACELLGLHDPALGRWRAEVRALTPDKIHPSGRAHYSFLRAAAAGYDRVEPLLGTEMSVGPEEFRQYAADESRACFVKRIDVYIDSEWTRQGIVLVDTPGADSVHARHTGVTFDYMKNADALVFVTYYNHAFSRADRQFLAQLGRVKGSDTVDKTFFVVNAADLADSAEECEGVTGHLEERLRGEGILRPRIYPVSSIQALDAKRAGRTVSAARAEAAFSGRSDTSFDRFAHFERDLMHFAAEELAGLAAAAADREIAAAQARLTRWLEEAAQGEQERRGRLERLERASARAKTMIEEAGTADKMPELTREIRELLFHVRQRIEFRFGDWFAESFNPALLHTGVGDLKSSFLACGRELSRMIAREAENELLATGLRIERAGQRMLSEALGDTRERLAALGAPFDSLQYGDGGPWETPEISEVQLGGALDWSSLWPLFKNPKAFFEQRGRDVVKEAALATFREALQHITDARLPEFESFYGRQLAGKLEAEASELRRRAEEAAQGVTISLSGRPDTERWQEIRQRLQEVLKSAPQV
ncbi:GTPase, partial [Saccharibacillus sp. O23]|uniref:dynamin family protein n=1 Tax=Saccharibacillus sp. O23 TaxID=2009338 RepID=UPI000B72CC3D